MVTELARLPGVTFEAPPPQRQDTLPRMDICAFVGFAASGPLHVPVAIESPRRFRDLFGADPILAWDDERGQFRSGHLGAAVDAFFANGGSRCWIVRVANTATMARHEFEIPGLIAAEDRLSSPETLARARARSAGTWCETLAVATTLNRDTLPLIDPIGGSPPLAAGGYRFELAVDRSRVQAGDLFEITFGPGGPVLLLFAARAVPMAGGMRIESAAIDSTGETEGAYWIQPAPPGSPASAVDPETTAPLPITETLAIPAALTSIGSPQARPVVRRLSFDLLIYRGSEQQIALANLAFCSRHPRFWGDLPTDDELFRPRPGEKRVEEPAGLAREAASPRFPLAGSAVAPVLPGTPAPTRYFLPWGMGRARTVDAARPLAPEATAGSTTLARDGLEAFASGLFLDDRLARMYSGALLREAEHRHYVAQIPLTGLHCLLAVDEVSLVAVPDAVHRQWDRALPPQPIPLGAPALDPVPPPDAAGRYPLTWSGVNGADAYTLQRDIDPAFETAVTAFEGDALASAVVIPPGCPRDFFFRVRASRLGEVGPWSNTRTAHLPGEDFAGCDGDRPAALVLEFSGDLASPGPALTWSTADPAVPLPVEWELQAATDSGFGTAVAFVPDGASAGFAPLPPRRVSGQYYRIRGVAGASYGVWSNTVYAPATDRAEFTEVPSAAYDAGSLLAIHRALLRFAAARGDFLALLSLPDHYRPLEALAHIGLLTPGGDEEEPTQAVGSGPLFPRVPPLTEGEAPLLSFGALYHPWAAMRSASGRDGAEIEAPIRLSPPDGAIAGLMAATAAEAGAWRAPANRPLAGVLALQPPLDVDAWRRLVPARVNVLLRDPRGFIAKSEETLGGERALARVHVRRLMILLRRLALREGERFVFEPHGPQLRRRVRTVFEQLLGELFQRGAFDGRDAAAAFQVVTDETVNRPATVDRGQLLVELRVAPAAALAYLTVRLVSAGAAGLAVEEA
jgi:hypothetical protein